MNNITCANILRPNEKFMALLYDLVLVVSGSILIAVSARIVVPLPFSPVPITAQTLAVLLIGALFGPSRAGICVTFYIFQGIAGIPVFAGGMAGLAHLAGPTGGYILGFLVSAPVVGYLAVRSGVDRRFWTILLVMALGNTIIYALGLSWLSAFVGMDNALKLGLYPFVLGDIVKIILAAVLLPTAKKYILYLADKSEQF